jgi:hypothetical protein
MDAQPFFVMTHESIQHMVERRLLNRLNEEQMRTKPRPGVNSVAWLLWHMARLEDVAVSRFVLGCPQMLAQGRWDLGVARQDVGFGMTDEEVAEFSAAVDVPALLEYYRSVSRKTREMMLSLRPETFDELVDAAHVQRVIAEEGILTVLGYAPPHLEGRTKGNFLAYLALRHKVDHFAEASYVCGLLDGRDS